MLEHGEDRADQHGSLEPAEHRDRLVSRIPQTPTLSRDLKRHQAALERLPRAAQRVT